MLVKDRQIYVRFVVKRLDTGASLAAFNVTLDVPDGTSRSEVEKHIDHLRVQAIRDTIAVDEHVWSDIPEDEAVRRDTFGRPDALWTGAILSGKGE
ncbi:MAG: hypothetical protein IPK79_00105 [Vampirovibrionales bacterium]|nr:hypothetical protein [Vampirovibrionales bacterium]